jgi:hypothetical protein
MINGEEAYESLDAYLESAYPFSKQRATSLESEVLREEAINELYYYIMEQIEKGIEQKTALANAEKIVRANLAKPKRPVMREGVHIMEEVQALVEATLK